MSINKISGNTQGVDVANRLKDIGSDNNINNVKTQETSISKDELKTSPEFNAIQDAVSNLVMEDAPIDSSKVAAAIKDLQSGNLGSLSSDSQVRLETAQRIANNLFGDI